MDTGGPHRTEDSDTPKASGTDAFPCYLTCVTHCFVAAENDLGHVSVGQWACEHVPMELWGETCSQQEPERSVVAVVTGMFVFKLTLDRSEKQTSLLSHETFRQILCPQKSTRDHLTKCTEPSAAQKWDLYTFKATVVSCILPVTPDVYANLCGHIFNG